MILLPRKASGHAILRGGRRKESPKLALACPELNCPLRKGREGERTEVRAKVLLPPQPPPRGGWREL